MLKLLRRILLLLIVLVFVGVCIIAGIGYLGYKDVIEEVPIETKISQIQATEHYTSLENVSPYFREAIISIEDRRFYDHGGVDYYALARSFVVNVTNTGRQGGSTLTQQLAKNMYFMDDNSGLRKVSEAFVARELEAQYEKDEILELYMNVVYYGDGYYGIYDASMGYFGVEPKALSLGQASMLAGLPQAPSIYALSKQDPISKDRQRQVLNSMYELKYITKQQYDTAIQEEVY